VPFDFNEFLSAFHRLKQDLISALVMQSPDGGLPFEVMCVAGDYTMGAVLGQWEQF